MRFIRKLFFGIILIVAVTAAFALWHPRSPLPDAWNPFRPFDVTHALTPMTQYKLNEVLTSGQMCLEALATGAEFDLLPDLEASETCHIRNRVALRSVAGVPMSPVETRCQTALRLAMWAEHGIKPAAQMHFAQRPARIIHNSSYNCRRIRTVAGTGARMSTHATAEAIDISGVVLDDGRRLMLLEGWTAPGAQAAFFRDLRDHACDWFRVTLGPEYNSLHADHFHLQASGWGLCR